MQQATPEQRLAAFIASENTTFRLTQALDTMAQINSENTTVRDEWRKLKYNLLGHIDKLNAVIVKDPNYCHNCGDPNGHGPAWVRCPMAGERR